MAWVSGSRGSGGLAEPHLIGNTSDVEAWPDLHTQFEDLLNIVFAAEATWRFYDRLDLADQLQPPRTRQLKR